MALVKRKPLLAKAKRRDVLVALCKSFRVPYTLPGKVVKNKLATVAQLIARLQEFVQ